MPVSVRWRRPVPVDLRSGIAAGVFFLLFLRQFSFFGGRMFFYPLFWAFRLLVIGVCLLLREPCREEPGIWTTGFALFSTFLPLAYTPGNLRWVDSGNAVLFFVALLLFGAVFSLWGIVSLGRSFGISPAKRSIVSSGPYRFMNHPIYAGYALSECALVMLIPSPLNFAILAASLACYGIRASMESRLLAA